MTTAARNLIGPLALIGGFAGFTTFGRSALKSADAIGKFAARIGISSKAQQEYRHAFDLNSLGDAHIGYLGINSI